MKPFFFVQWKWFVISASFSHELLNLPVFFFCVVFDNVCGATFVNSEP